MDETNINVPVPADTTTSQLPKASQIFNEAWAIYKRRIKTLIAITLIPTLAYLLFIALFVGGGAVALKFLKLDIVALGIFGLILGLAAIIFIIYLSVWGAVAEIYAIKDQAENIGWKEAYKRSRHKINPFFSTNLLAGLAVVGGFILLIIPGIIFALWFSQASYVVVEEDLANTAALKRSKYYVKGRWGEVFGKFFYIGVISIGIYLAVVLLLWILSQIGIKQEYTSWIGNVFSFVWTPMVSVYAYLLYKYLKASRPA